MTEQTSDFLARKLRENWLTRVSNDAAADDVEPDDSLTNLNWLQDLSLSKFAYSGTPLSPLCESSLTDILVSSNPRKFNGTKNHIVKKPRPTSPLSLPNLRICSDEKQYIDVYSTGQPHQRPSVLSGSRRNRVNRLHLRDVKDSRYKIFAPPPFRRINSSILGRVGRDLTNICSFKNTIPNLLLSQTMTQQSHATICNSQNSTSTLVIQPTVQTLVSCSLNPSTTAVPPDNHPGKYFNINAEQVPSNTNGVLPPILLDSQTRKPHILPPALLTRHDTQIRASQQNEFIDISTLDIPLSLDCIAAQVRESYRTELSTKPPFSVPTIIHMCMTSLNKAKITLSELEPWIMNNFAYFRDISINLKEHLHQILLHNRCFQRVPRRKEEPGGRGELWRLNPEFQVQLDKKEISRTFWQHWNEPFPSFSQQPKYSDPCSPSIESPLADSENNFTNRKRRKVSRTVVLPSNQTSAAVSDQASCSTSSCSPTLSDMCTPPHSTHDPSIHTASCCPEEVMFSQPNSDINLLSSYESHQQSLFSDYYINVDSTESAALPQESREIDWSNPCDLDDISLMGLAFEENATEPQLSSDWFDTSLSDCLKNIFSQPNSPQDLSFITSESTTTKDLETSHQLSTPDVGLDKDVFKADFQYTDFSGAQLGENLDNSTVDRTTNDLYALPDVADQFWMDEPLNLKELDSILGLA